MSKIVKLEQKDCSACKMVSQYLDGQGVQYESVNVFDDPDTAIKYGVMMSVPVTVLVDDNDEVVQRSEGYKTTEIQQIIDAYKGAN